MYGLDLSHNTEYQDIINRVFSGADDFRNIEIDTESFEVPVLYFKGNEDIFVSEYQRRLYMDEDVVDENGNIKAVAVQEYFAEGYREFILNEQILAEKDAVLYEFIKGLIE